MKTVLVTAASKGIGFSIAEQFLKEGNTVLISSSNSEHLDYAYHKLASRFPDKVQRKLCNLRNRTDVQNFITYLQDASITIDILVNNCGGPQAGYYDAISDDQWDDAYQEIFHTARMLTEAVLPGMKARKWGRIINITSIAVKHYIDNLILSTSMRSALSAYTGILAKQVASFAITANCVAPGYTLTDRITELAEKRAIVAGVTAEEMLTTMAANVPLGRFARPEEIAAVTAFLGSDVAGYITGQTILIDGGLNRNIN